MEQRPIKLTLEQTRTLENLQPAIDFLESELTKAKAAGLEIDDLAQKVSNLKKKRAGLLRVYGFDSTEG